MQNICDIIKRYHVREFGKSKGEAEMMEKFKKWSAIWLAGVLAASCMAGCAKEEAESKPDIVTIEAKLPETGDMVLTNEFIGNILPQEEVYVVAMVSAEVMENCVAVGDTVAQGDVLCRLDDEAAKLALENANAAYASAKAGIAQAQGAAVQMQDLQTQAGIDSLESQIASTQKTLTDTNNDLKEAAEDLEDAEDALNSAKKAASGAQSQYKQAVAIATGWKTIQATAADYQDKTLAEGAQTAAGILANADTADPAAVATATEVAKLAEQMAKAKLDESALTADGIKALAETVAKYQSAVTSAATAQAQLEMQRKSYQRGVESAQTGLNTLEENLETAKQTAELSQGQARTEQNAVYDAQLNSASVGIKSAQMQLDLYTLTAPISGTVEAVNVSEHGFASVGSPAYVISNKNNMTVVFSVSEGIRNTFAIGQKIAVDKNGALYDGAITEIAPMVNAQTGLFTVKASVAADGSELLTGTKVKVTADTYHEDNILLIPYDAVYYDNGQAYVYCIQDGYAKRADVETGLFDASRISVLSGITADTQIITTWAAGLKDGAKISVKEADDAKEAE